MDPVESATGRDPVCGMNVILENATPYAEYRGTRFHFCSEHCRERFTQHPGLYVGAHRTGERAPLIKRRRLYFQGADVAVLAALADRLRTRMGIEAAEACRKGLRVAYDLRLTDLQEIEAAATRAGLHLRGGLHGLRRGLWKFSEGNELANAARPGGGACCSRPPTKLR